MVRTCIPDRTMQCKSRHIKVEWMHLRVQCNTLHSGLQQQWWYWEGFLQALVSHSSHSPFTWPAPAALQQLTLPTQTQMPIQIQSQTQMPIQIQTQMPIQSQTQMAIQIQSDSYFTLHSAQQCCICKAKHLEVRITNGIDLHWLISINNALSGNDTRKWHLREDQRMTLERTPESDTRENTREWHLREHQRVTLERTPESDTRENTTHVGAHPLPLDVLMSSLIFWLSLIRHQKQIQIWWDEQACLTGLRNIQSQNRHF